MWHSRKGIRHTSIRGIWRGNGEIWAGPGRRLLALKWATCAALLSAMAWSPRVWVAERPFPTVPALPAIPDLPQAPTAALSLLLVIGLLAVAVLPRPARLGFAPPALAATLVLFDVNRLQPWAYEYLAMLLALGFVDPDDPGSRRSRAAWAACAAIVVGIYVWSGLQKVNSSFAREVFPWLLEPLGPTAVDRFRALWPVAPAIETSVGLLLLIPRMRPWGLAGAVAMHAVLLLALGPLGQNYDSIVWPWNLWAMVLAATLFFRNGASVPRLAWSTRFGRATLLLFGLLPSLSFVGLWDGFLSGSFYSGKLRDGWIYLTAEGVRRLPSAYVEGNVGLVEESPLRYRLDVMRWSMSRLDLPPYAEPRAYTAIARRLVKEGVPPNDMILLVRDRPSLTEAQETYSELPIQ